MSAFASTWSFVHSDREDWEEFTSSSVGPSRRVLQRMAAWPLIAEGAGTVARDTGAFFIWSDP